MKLRSVVRDCLFLNWALPVEALPEPPAPLRYQRFSWQGHDHAFVSALLFHHDAVRLRALPLLRVGYPQLNVRSYVLDEEGMPSVLFHRELMPAWVAPGMRLVAGHPAASARLDFPRPSQDVGAKSWSWRVERGGTLTVRARVHSPTVGEGPRIGSWEETVRFFQERPRGYAMQDRTLRRVDVWHPPAEGIWPLAAEITGSDDLLRRLLRLSPEVRDEQPAKAAPRARSAQGEPVWPQDGGRPFSAAAGSAEPQEIDEVEGMPPAAGAAAATAVALAPPSLVPAAPPPPGSPDSEDGGSAWPQLHSCWLCPEMPFSIVFDLVPKVHPVVQQLPHPAAGRISSPALRDGSPGERLDAAVDPGLATPAAEPVRSAVAGDAARAGSRADRAPVAARSRVRATAA